MTQSDHTWLYVIYLGDEHKSPREPLASGGVANYWYPAVVPCEFNVVASGEVFLIQYG